MTHAVCSIITPNYVAFTGALLHSLNKHARAGIDMFVFIAAPRADIGVKLPILPRLTYLFIEDLCENGAGKRLKDKYIEVNLSAFRWAMKPVLLSHLLVQKRYRKVIFLDGDLYFYSDYQFLFDKLEHSRVLLTPHWRSKDPLQDPRNFQELLNKGMYNAGFIAVNQDALPVLSWWTGLCEYKCHFEPEKGLYADQGYLNLFPIYFEGIEILKHRGCNVANWNLMECRRVRRPNGEVVINDEFPIVFIHYTSNTIRAILSGKDALLMPHLEEYAETLKAFDPQLDIISVNRKKEVKKKKSLLKRVGKAFKNWLKV